MAACKNVVSEWLRVIGLSQYSDSFMENGYDELEICKQIGEVDLDAIGVENIAHRNKLARSVRNLREKGAAIVYVMINDPKALTRSNEILSECDIETTPKKLEYVMKKHLEVDGIRLTAHPYSTPEGNRGYLEGLAAHYSRHISMPYENVLEAIEKCRQAKWTERHVRVTAGLTTSRPFRDPNNSFSLHSHQNQPIYAPGKYLPSSCLSNREENEIYSFTNQDFSSRISRSAIESKSTLNLSSRQDRKAKRSTMFTRFLSSLKINAGDFNQVEGVQLKLKDQKAAFTRKGPHDVRKEVTIHSKVLSEGYLKET